VSVCVRVSISRAVAAAPFVCTKMIRLCLLDEEWMVVRNEKGTILTFLSLSSLFLPSALCSLIVRWVDVDLGFGFLRLHPFFFLCVCESPFFTLSLLYLLFFD